MYNINYVVLHSDSLPADRQLPPVYNLSDETKLVSPRPNATTTSTTIATIEAHSNNMQLAVSPRCTSSSSEAFSTKRPLTRRKWLESSDGGFIFGSPSIQTG